MLLTLSLIQQNNQLLLGHKKRGFGAGKWNGFGGKVNPGEGIQAAAYRELHEETTLKAISSEECGILRFTFAGDPKVLEVHVFAILEYTGTPQETEEMRPQWFTLDTIPYQQMWADDKLWFPLFIAGKKITGDFHFQDTETLLTHSLKQVDEL